MKRIVIAAMAMSLVMGITACSDTTEDATTEEVTTEASVTDAYDESDAIRSDIVKFINEDLPSIESERNSAVAVYNSYFEDGGSDSESWVSSLESEAIVSYDSYLEKLAAFTYETSQVTELRDLYLSSAQCQRDAIMSVITGLKNGDSSFTTDTNTYIDQSKEYLTQYQELLQTLCSENNITIKNSSQTASGTDAE